MNNEFIPNNDIWILEIDGYCNPEEQLDELVGVNNIMSMLIFQQFQTDEVSSYLQSFLSEIFEELMSIEIRIGYSCLTFSSNYDKKEALKLFDIVAKPNVFVFTSEDNNILSQGFSKIEQNMGCFSCT